MGDRHEFDEHGPSEYGVIAGLKVSNLEGEELDAIVLRPTEGDWERHPSNRVRGFAPHNVIERILARYK